MREFISDITPHRSPLMRIIDTMILSLQLAYKT